MKPFDFDEYKKQTPKLNLSDEQIKNVLQPTNVYQPHNTIQDEPVKKFIEQKVEEKKTKDLKEKIMLWSTVAAAIFSFLSVLISIFK